MSACGAAGGGEVVVEQHHRRQRRGAAARRRRGLRDALQAVGDRFHGVAGRADAFGFAVGGGLGGVVHQIGGVAMGDERAQLLAPE